MEARKSRTCCYIGGSTYCFGYDPATKKHKVMCMWNMSRKQDDGTILDGLVCEILTLGHNSWRKIEAAPPHHFCRIVCSVYVNGSVYWFPGIVECDNDDDVFMVAFDVGNEKFRTIQISKFRSGSKPSDPDPFLDRCHLLEVNGCVAILRRNTADTADLWVYEDSDKESTYKATTMNSTDKKWTKHTITLPVHWVEERDMYFHTTTGADQIILETHLMNSDGRSKAVSVYSYDLKKKFFEEIKISGIPLSIPLYFDSRLCISFSESLLSLSEA
ncbi:F-box protein At5g65850-like [Papaver somniferum]|uniref:F-box protein At5g65850-like n=1 Tax=Papaver somniferum TaxID=3469 RepID=UPI000E6F9F65|nr:F-box protein At5g65850-like [Papaver somniferum]